jgi:hypothetical protein
MDTAYKMNSACPT